MLHRRPLVLATSLSPVTPLFAMDPVTLAILTTLISAVGSIFAAKIAAQASGDAQIRVLEKQWAMEQAKLQAARYGTSAYPIADRPVHQQTAYGPDGARLSAGWTDDLDGAGTYAGLAGGRIGLERGKYSGIITSTEAQRLSQGLSRGEPMAVPVEGGYHTYSAREADQLHAALSKSFRSGESLVGGRRYSRASSPTASGWDLESVMVASPSGEVRALAVSRNALHA